MYFPKILRSFCIFCLSYVTLTLIPYLPYNVLLSISAFLSLLSFIAPQISIIIFSAVFFIVLSYHSLTLSILYIVAIIPLLAIFAYKEEDFSNIFIFFSMAPILAHFNLGLEFSIVFIAATAYQKDYAFLISFFACIAGLVIGMLSGNLKLGYFLLVEPGIVFFKLKTPPDMFYSLKWFPSQESIQVINRGSLYLIPKNILRLFFSNIHIMLLPIVWGVASFIFGNSMQSKGIKSLINSFLYSIGILAGGYGLIVMFFAPDTGFSFLIFVAELIALVLVYLVGFQIYSFEKRRFSKKNELERTYEEKKKLEREYGYDEYLLEDEYREDQNDSYASKISLQALEKERSELKKKYTDWKEIGSGSIGTVFSAYDPILKHPVALKIISVEKIRNPAAVEGFIKEILMITELMSHPGLVVIYNTENGILPHISMELIKGESLREVLVEKGALPYNKVLDIGIQVCEILDLAHNKGIIHSDIKPENILLTDDGRVKISDFGMSLIDVGTRLMSNGDPGMKKWYLSPEQIRRDAIDHMTDIYSLGITLYELSCGQFPYEKGDVSSHEFKEEAVPLYKRNASIPEGFNSIILKCIENEPGKRYNSCKKIAEKILAEKERSLIKNGNDIS